MKFNPIFLILVLFSFSLVCFRLDNGIDSCFSAKRMATTAYSSHQTSDFIPTQQIQPKLPYNIVSAGVASNGSHFFLLGGTNDSYRGMQSILAVDSQTFTRVQIVSYLNYPVYGMGTIQLKNRIYLIGGVHLGTKIRNITCFNLETLVIEPVTSQLPVGLEFPSVALKDGLIYIFSGTVANPEVFWTNSDIYLFNPIEDTIEVLPATTPTYLFNPAVYATETEILLFGGVYLDRTIYTDEIWSFNLQTYELSKKSAVLPARMRIVRFLALEKYLYSFDIVNETGSYNNIIKIDTQSLISEVVKYDFLVPQRHDFAIGSNDFNIYILGGRANDDIWGHDSIYRLPIQSFILPSSFFSTFNSEDWSNSHLSNFRYKPYQNITWTFYGNSSESSTQCERITRLKDCFDIEMIYRAHWDPNTRQVINLGWTDSCSFERPDYLRYCPSHYFLGFTIKNVFTNVQISAKIIREMETLHQTIVILPQNLTHTLRWQLWIKDATHFLQIITIDGLVYSEGMATGNLTGILVNQFSIWNQKTSNFPSEGMYSGAISFIRYREDIDIPLSKHWYKYQEELFSSSPATLPPLIFLLFFLLFAFFLIIPSYFFILTTNIGKSLYLRYRRKPIEGVPPHLVPSTLYSLYKRLKERFKRLELMINESLELEEEKSQANSKPPRLWTEISCPLSEEDLYNLRALNLEILIYLLNYYKIGTYTSSLKIDFKLGRSTLFYNLRILEERGLIMRSAPPLNEDQRMNIVCITQKGMIFLYQLYLKLDAFFNQ